jgi:hypothetical protein
LFLRGIVRLDSKARPDEKTVMGLLVRCHKPLRSAAPGAERNMIAAIVSWFQLSTTATNWTVADHDVVTGVSKRAVLLSDVSTDASTIANNRTSSKLF